MTYQHKQLLIGLGLLSVLLTGCNAVGKMAPALDDQAKVMVAPDDKALVYIVRPARTGSKVGMTVTCDGIYLGKTGGKRYIVTTVTPGKHHFISKAENQSELTFILEAGSTYFLEQKVKMGFFKSRNNLERISDSEGREKLQKCSLSDDLGKGPMSLIGS